METTELQQLIKLTTLSVGELERQLNLQQGYLSRVKAGKRKLTEEQATLLTILAEAGEVKKALPVEKNAEETRKEKIEKHFELKSFDLPKKKDPITIQNFTDNAKAAVVHNVKRPNDNLLDLL